MSAEFLSDGGEAGKTGSAGCGGGVSVEVLVPASISRVLA